MAAFLIRRRALLASAGLAAWPIRAPAAAGRSPAMTGGGFEISREQLQAAVDSRFPISRRLAEGIDLTVEAPRLALRAETNRIGLDCDVAGRGGMLARPLAGRFAASHGLLFEPADDTVRAVGVQVERMHIVGLDPAFERLLEQLLRPSVERLLERQVLYQLRPRELETLRAAALAPGEIRVAPDGIVVSLVPSLR